MKQSQLCVANNSMKRLFASLALMLPLVASAQYVSKVWSPDNGDGTYTNPVINADYSDPDVCVVGEERIVKLTP